MPLMINYIWFGSGALGALEKFNIYCWRATGANVTVYSCKWDTSPHSAGSLGLKDVTVVDLCAHVKADTSPLVPHVRELLTAWFDAAKLAPPSIKDEAVGKPFIFNVGDASKGFICSTQLGIVMDLKVGPSAHLAEYLPLLTNKFVSYTRGGKAPIENQCMGTMNAGLRDAYAGGFDAACANAAVEGAFENYKSTPTTSHFNTITRWHQQGAIKAKWVDTAKFGPNGGVPEKVKQGGQQVSKYMVREIGGNGHGPFRVFKKASDQSNNPSGSPTTPKDVRALADWVWANELDKLLKADDATVNQRKFLREVQAALTVMPK